ncbi:hypothetical protein LTR91_015609 [Friedmanniomyces endolithicus]|uniref:Transcription factor domain-containing protein n=1 Tax=Friedmanniomyces endolithicus TaxID=329885 RepID=A0AAN6K9H1_9PEZI|nr:hypothetical protein LTR57_015452 [Friedmanniomyces endolithicus]KAK0971225.1 hypothetical protein LTR91_015609 [Friedmanniomyces endolithicus]KAK1006640.1 hypothetical protein LTS01_003003 [Friedmanniomyces endolithicus]KAK1038105.1 hypothetical protein LTS16_012254 [Friedmanniomyces endolithicus]
MTDTQSKYAIACSRESTGCQRCIHEALDCKYSRIGVQRRARKRNAPPSTPDPRQLDSRRACTAPTAAGEFGASQWEDSFETIREKMPPVDTKGPGPYKVLSTLADEVECFWRDRPDLSAGSGDLPRSQKGYFLFEEHAESWTNLFSRGLVRYRPLLTAAPVEVLESLATSRPEQVRERAWLVIYYGIILTSLPLDMVDVEKTRSRLRANLWLAFNDTRLLLEPSDPNIQALAFLACHVYPFTTPSLCWMLLSNACRMLRALAVNQRVADPETKERRIILFWYLNSLEKAMMLIFPWPGAFHRTMYNNIPLPTLTQILPSQPQVGTDKRASLFGAHWMQMSFVMSKVMTDIWLALDEEDVRAQRAAKQALDAWYREAMQVLEAAALAETPLLDPAGARSVQFGLAYTRVQYHGAEIVLTRGSSQESSFCRDESLKMLRLLEDLVANGEEPYIGVTWQMLYFPWAPFLVLFGSIMSSGAAGRTFENEQALSAMELLPTYFRNMSLRYVEAKRLEKMAAATVQRARSILHPEEALPTNGSSKGEQVPEMHSLPTPSLSTHDGGSAPSPASTAHRGGAARQERATEDSGMPGAGPWLWGDMDMLPQAWPSGFEDSLFADPVFDWFAWEGQT